jgi:hypothetical protein
MDPTQPQSAAAVILLPFVAAIFWGTRVATCRVTHDDLMARLTAPAVAGSLWLLAVHTIALMTQSFPRGLWIGTIVAGVAAVALGWRDRRAFSVARPLPPVMWVPAVAATLLFTPAALGWSFHDELWHAGHQSIASQIQNGIYPPRHGVFPVFLLRYHYGFDLLVAMVGTIARLPVERAIDAVTIVAWFYTWCLAWGLGERLLGARRGWILPLTVLFAGSLVPFLALSGTPATARALLGLIKIDGATVNPPLVSYFFQHPWTIGFPLALATLGLGLDRTVERPAWRAAFLFLLFLALAFTQIILFLALLSTMALVQFLLHLRTAPRESLAWMAGAAATLAVATQLGGFFASGPHTGLEITLHPWSQTGRATSNLLWNVVSFGWTLPLGIAGLVPLLRRDVAWGLVIGGVIIGGLVLMNLLRYEHSWDIVKFGTAAMFASGIAACTVIARLWSAPSRPLARTAAVVALVLVAFPGVGFLTCFAVSAPGIPPQIFFSQPPPVAANHRAAIAWLRRQVRAGDLVVCTPELTSRYAQIGGLPVLPIDSGTIGFGFPADVMQRRQTITSDVPMDPQVYRSEGVRWIVAADDSRFVPPDRLTTWRQDGAIVEVQRFGDVAIYELLATPGRVHGGSLAKPPTDS